MAHLDDLFSIRRRWFHNDNIDVTDERLHMFFERYDVFYEDYPGNNILSYSNKMSNEQIDLLCLYINTIYDHDGKVIYIDNTHNPYLLQKLLEMDERGDYAFQKNHHLNLGDRVNGYEKVTLLTFLKSKVSPRTHPMERDKIQKMINMLHEHTQKKLTLLGMMMHRFEVEVGFNQSKKRHFY